MSPEMTEKDWVAAPEVFRASLPRRGDKGRDDIFLGSRQPGKRGKKGRRSAARAAALPPRST